MLRACARVPLLLLLQVPTNFSLVKQPSSEPPSHPKVLLSSPVSRLWHTTDTSYKVPMGLVGIKYYIPALTGDLEAQLDASLLMHMLVSQIRSMLYELGEASEAVQVRVHACARACARAGAHA